MNDQKSNDHSQNAAQHIGSKPQSFGGLLVVCALTLSVGVLSVLKLEQSYQMPYVATLQATKTVLRAPHAGVIESSKIHEGTQVVPGMVVMKISDSDLSSQIATKEQEVEKLESLYAQSRAKVEMEIAWRTKSVDQEIFTARIDKSNQIHKLYFAEMQQVAWTDYLKTKTQVATTNYSPEVMKSIIDIKQNPDDTYINAMLQQGAAENDAAVYQAQVEMCKKRIEELTGVKNSIPEQLRIAEGLELAESNRNRARKELEELETLREELLVASQSHGKLGAVRNRVGDYVQKGETVAELWDYAKNYLETYIPSSDAHKFEVGQKIKLQFPGNKTAYGLVAHIPLQTIPASQLPLRSGISDEDSIVPIRIEPVDSIWPTVPLGSKVRVGLPNVK